MIDVETRPSGPDAQPPVAFKDVHDYDASIYYAVPNEDTMCWRNVLKYRPIYKAGAICSSGEVGLFSILPLVRDELVLVDHSCRSLHIAMVKYLLLRELGARETQRLFTAVSARSERRAAIDRVKEHLPARLAKAFDGRDHPLVTYSLDGEWRKLPERVVKKSVSKLARVRFLHGDLTDLVAEGPFGLLYLSNALEHVSRSKKRPVLAQIAKAVRPGGYILAATTSGSRFNVDGDGKWHYSLTEAGYELVDSKRLGSYGWTHGLYRVP